MKLEPNNVHARMELGMLYEKQGRVNCAKKLYTECLKIDPKDEYVKVVVGNFYINQGNVVKAKKLFLDCIKLKISFKRNRRNKKEKQTGFYNI